MRRHSNVHYIHSKRFQCCRARISTLESLEFNNRHHTLIDHVSTETHVLITHFDLLFNLHLAAKHLIRFFFNV